MKVFVCGVIVGMLGLGAVVWYFHRQSDKSVLQEAREHIVADAKEAGTAARSQLDVLGLTPDNIRDELARTGKVIRRKTEAAGAAISDATADARITAAIKLKLVGDPDLSAVSISVNTTDGCVTLSGSVSSLQNISRAMALAYDTDGVTQVISVLQVK